MSPRRRESPIARATDRESADRAVPPGVTGRSGAPRARTASASGAPSLTVAAVARRLGVAPATLRTWDRRYGLGPSEHLAGSHRRYSTADVARLVVMRRLTLEGVAPSEAARSALATADEDASASGVAGAHGGAGPGDQVIDVFSEAVPLAPDPPALVSAASHFDSAAMRWMLARVHPRDTIAWWTELVEPALRVVAGRSHLDRPGESVGAALTAAAFAELRSRGAVSAARARSGRTGDGGEPEGVAAGGAGDPGLQAGGAAGRAGVLALALGDGPPLVVHVLATALQARGVATWVLSGDGHAGLSGTLDKLRPAAVVLDVGPAHHLRSHEESPGQAARVSAALRRLVEADPDVPVFVHRRGSAPVDLPRSGMVHRVRTLTGALHEILAVTS